MFGFRNVPASPPLTEGLTRRDEATRLSLVLIPLSNCNCYRRVYFTNLNAIFPIQNYLAHVTVDIPIIWATIERYISRKLYAKQVN